MAFPIMAPKTPTQALDSIITSHRALFQHFDQAKSDLASMLERYKNLQPTMNNLARTCLSKLIEGSKSHFFDFANKN